MQYHRLYVQPCVANGPKTLLKVKDFRASFPCFDGVMTVIVLSSSPATLLEELTFPGKKGRTRQYTLIFPGKEETRCISMLCCPWKMHVHCTILHYLYHKEQKRVPLRSCIWLYSLRFSSRTLWYPEAAWERVCTCFPDTEKKEYVMPWKISRELWKILWIFGTQNSVYQAYQGLQSTAVWCAPSQTS